MFLKSGGENIIHEDKCDSEIGMRSCRDVFRRLANIYDGKYWENSYRVNYSHN